MKEKKILLMFGSREYVASVAKNIGESLSVSSSSNGLSSSKDIGGRWVIVGCIKMDYDEAALGMLAIRAEMQGACLSCFTILTVLGAHEYAVSSSNGLGSKSTDHWRSYRTDRYVV